MQTFWTNTTAPQTFSAPIRNGECPTCKCPLGDLPDAFATGDIRCKCGHQWEGRAAQTFMDPPKTGVQRFALPLRPTKQATPPAAAPSTPLTFAEARTRAITERQQFADEIDRKGELVAGARGLTKAQGVSLVYTSDPALFKRWQELRDVDGRARQMTTGTTAATAGLTFADAQAKAVTDRDRVWDSIKQAGKQFAATHGLTEAQGIAKYTEIHPEKYREWQAVRNVDARAQELMTGR